MTEVFPYMNPLRLHQWTGGNIIDYANTLPTFDKMFLREKYQRGIYPGEAYPVFAYGEPFTLQVNNDIIFEQSVMNLDTAAITNLVREEITPPSWAGTYKIWKIIVPVLPIGRYRMTVDLYVPSFSFSDEFLIQDWSKNKDLVKIQYYDTQNRNAAVFFNGVDSEPVWAPVVYYNGFIKKGATEYNRKVYNDQPNNTRVQRATPKLKDVLTITDVHQTYYDNISYQFSCDTVFVNGTQYAVEEVGDPEPVGQNSDLINVNITLSRNSNNGMQQI